MLNFKEFREKSEDKLLDVWGRLIAEPISAQEYIDLASKISYEDYLRGFQDALDDISAEIGEMCGSRMYSDGDDAFDATFEAVERFKHNSENAKTYGGRK